MRAVDVRELRRGDQVCVPLNPVRTLIPALDFILSYAFCLELISACHHTIIIDDVAYVDDKGIPRKADGLPAMIFDLSNTALDWLGAMSPVGFWPTAVLTFALNKGETMFIPLAEYGDSPIMLRVDDGEKGDKERDAIVQRCEDVWATFDDKKFNLMTNNCEHTCNAVVRGERRSPEVVYMWCWLGSLLTRVLPLMLSFTTDNPTVLGFVIPSCVGLLVVEQCICLSLRMVLGRRKWKQHLALHDYRHLVTKEITRALLNVCLHAALLVALQRGSSLRFCGLVLLLAPGIHAIFSILGGHLVMFLLFLASGSVWHFPPRFPKDNTDVSLPSSSCRQQARKKKKPKNA
jgi:hypothetical protein